MPRPHITRRTLLSFLVAGSLMSPAFAENALLTVTGDLPGAADLTLNESDLLALPQLEFETGTIWTAGRQIFSGPALSGLLDSIGAGTGDLELAAANNYKVRLPRSIVENEAPIVALRIDGNPFGVREKGPLWLVFPYDREEKYQTEEIYAFSIWQLTSISVLKD